MLFFFFVGAVIFSSCCANVFTRGILQNSRNFSPSSRIVGGMEVKPHSAPFMVYLRANQEIICGATLISENYILTAAQCFEIKELTGVEIEAVLGAHGIKTKQPDEIVRRLADIIKHDKFKLEKIIMTIRKIENDIALAKLESPVEYTIAIKPVMLPSPSSTEGYTPTSGTIFGWGATGGIVNDWIKDSVLRAGEVNVLPSGRCETDIPITEKQICVPYDNVVSGENDAGGPLIVNDTQIGIISFYDLVPGADVFTFVSKYLEWIEEHSDVKLSLI